MGKIFSTLIDMSYPLKPKCLFCGSQENINYFGLCKYCVSLLPYISKPVCTRCGKPYSHGVSHDACSLCLNTEMYFEKGYTVFEFSGIVQNTLYRLKYGGETELADVFGKLMADYAAELKEHINLIIPVPLHIEKLKKRGFNQSWLICKALGREWGIDSSDKALVRSRYTESQINLSKKQRLSNVRGAFALNSRFKIQGKSVLIVDDIMTTGSTLNECSRMLKSGGASHVYALTAACPVHMDEPMADTEP